MSAKFIALSMLLATLVVYVKIFIKHQKDLVLFYNEIDGMLNNYYTVYPKEDLHYFSDLVEPESQTMWKIWVTDYNEFIINQNKLQELFDGNNKYNSTTNKIICPWCKNEEIQNFSYHTLDEKEPDKGILICLNCRSTTPIGKLKDGIFVIKGDYDKKI